MTASRIFASSRISSCSAAILSRARGDGRCGHKTSRETWSERAPCVSAPIEMKVDAGLGVRADAVLVDPARGLEQGPAPHERHRPLDLGGSHLSSRMRSAPAASACATCSRESASLSMGRSGAGARQRRWRGRCRRRCHVVVLDQHGGVEVLAVVRAAAAAHRLRSRARSPGVVLRVSRSGCPRADALDVAARQPGYAAQARERG